MQPIVTLSLPLDDARDLYHALVTRYIIESTLREEQGLEPISLPAIAERLEQTLGVLPDQAEHEGEQLEDELWEYAWLAFTDEWAWHRAKQDVAQELGKTLPRFSEDQLDQLTEQRYKSKFELYQKEVRLPGHEDGATCGWHIEEKPRERKKNTAKK